MDNAEFIYEHILNLSQAAWIDYPCLLALEKAMKRAKIKAMDQEIDDTVFEAKDADFESTVHGDDDDEDEVKNLVSDEEEYYSADSAKEKDEDVFDLKNLDKV